MPTAFPTRAARLSGSIDKAFGEGLILAARRPVADVNMPREADPDRITLTVVGTFDDPADAITPAARGHASNHAQQRIATQPMATVSDDQLPWMPRHGDLLTRVLTGETFSVSRAKPNGMGRTVIMLTAKTMTLARTALRLLAVAVLTGSDAARPTMAGPRVYDSRMDDLAPDTFSEDAKPILLVLTDEDDGEAISEANGGPPFRRNINLVIEMAMVERHKADGGYVVGYPDTDARLEASLDLLEHQIMDVLANGSTDAALAFQNIVRIRQRACHRQVTNDAGVKMACRMLTLTCEISDDHQPIPNTLPEPLRTVAAVLPVGSAGAAAVAAIAAALVPQPAVGVDFEGIDWRHDAGTADEDDHVIVGKTDFDQP